MAPRRTSPTLLIDVERFAALKVAPPSLAKRESDVNGRRLADQYGQAAVRAQYVL